MTKAVLERLKNKDSISPSFKFTYMLEEAIPGEFVKYIHNGDPRPILEPEEAPKEYELAQFLCFTQHLQYYIWEGVVFLSDYQGAGDLLTDPQILTNSALGEDLFSLGNLKEGFECFEKRHICNRYCDWYELEPFDINELEEEEEGGSGGESVRAPTSEKSGTVEGGHENDS
ncbi:kinase-like protein [Coprinellus micaceus]|uniref:Kinase-like protein n=1 Tax=Coprinellus micaceus TaxID=71717 RepID=A0A4Y7SXC7_COPMI|nr:kinase-like protein [Coprinellus micaceus]